MVFKIRVGDELKAFELSLGNILEAEQRHGVTIYNSDFSPPVSLGALAKFAVAGFMAEKPDITKDEALEWLQSCDDKALGVAVVDAFKRINGIRDDKEDGGEDDAETNVPLSRPPVTGT